MHFQKEWKSLTDENHWKKTSGGLKVQVIPLVLFSYDVGGNKSKKWNKFDAWAMLLAGLPRSTNCNLENIHFISASNLVDCLGQTKPLVEDLLELGIVMYDAMHEGLWHQCSAYLQITQGHLKLPTTWVHQQENGAGCVRYESRDPSPPRSY